MFSFDSFESDSATSSVAGDDCDVTAVAQSFQNFQTRIQRSSL